MSNFKTSRGMQQSIFSRHISNTFTRNMFLDLSRQLRLESNTKFVQYLYCRDTFSSKVLQEVCLL